jgi:hypothetical protein
MQLEIICLESPAFEMLIQRLVTHIKQMHDIQEDEFVSPEEAMRLLRISSKTTLSAYKNKGFLKFSMVSRKIILYSRTSIREFLSKREQSNF